MLITSGGCSIGQNNWYLLVVTWWLIHLRSIDFMWSFGVLFYLYVYICLLLWYLTFSTLIILKCRFLVSNTSFRTLYMRRPRSFYVGTFFFCYDRSSNNFSFLFRVFVHYSLSTSLMLYIINVQLTRFCLDSEWTPWNLCYFV